MSESLIKREVSPILNVNFSEGIARLTYENTGVFIFSPEFEDMNHTYIRENGSNEAIYIFRNPALISRLRELWYPTTFQKYPLDCDVEAYMNYSAGKLDKELGEL